MFYSAMSSEILLQICKATTKFQDLIKSAKTLIERTIKSNESHEKGSIETT